MDDAVSLQRSGIASDRDHPVGVALRKAQRIEDRFRIGLGDDDAEFHGDRLLSMDFSVSP